MADVELTPDESQFVQDLINNFAVENQNSNLRWQIPHVTQHDAIPLYCGWFETIGLTATGEIVMWNAEGEYDDLRKPDDPQNCHVFADGRPATIPATQIAPPSSTSTAVTCGPVPKALVEFPRCPKYIVNAAASAG